VREKQAGAVNPRHPVPQLATGRSLERPQQVQAGAGIDLFRRNVRFDGTDFPSPRSGRGSGTRQHRL